MCPHTHPANSNGGMSSSTDFSLACASAQRYYYSYYYSYYYYMCPHTNICVRICMFSHTGICVFMLLYLSLCKHTHTHTPIHRLFPRNEHKYEFLFLFKKKILTSGVRRLDEKKERTARALSLVFSSATTHIKQYADTYLVVPCSLQGCGAFTRARRRRRARA